MTAGTSKRQRYARSVSSIFLMVTCIAFGMVLAGVLRGTTPAWLLIFMALAIWQAFSFSRHIPDDRESRG